MSLASEHDEKSGSSRILYWWRPPVGPDRSADVGKGMIAVVIKWLAAVIMIVIIIGVVLAATA